MSIYILSPTLTAAPANAVPFLEAAGIDLELGVVCPIASETAAYTAQAQYGDGVVFANPEPGRQITEAARAFLERAEGVGAVVLPVPMSTESRNPPPVVSVRRSHDVADALRRRDLPHALTGSRTSSPESLWLASCPRWRSAAFDYPLLSANRRRRVSSGHRQGAQQAPFEVLP